MTDEQLARLAAAAAVVAATTGAQVVVVTNIFPQRANLTAADLHEIQRRPGRT